ncbi:hypothetical protein GGI25_005831 [Coemansia spiralis]|uniref:Uncharacterized protein n=2 Tax=Coemansia TaxID=4863 RepID=A0A9W8G3Y9_9FUNG|nr:hypothetical protein EDC05_005884 [Coemansia umbellata]KAJ2670475.1 hypothetical protein GGI25_005831 [Coemansia spiralis]
MIAAELRLEAPPEIGKKDEYPPDSVIATLLHLKAVLDNIDKKSNKPATNSIESYYYEWKNISDETSRMCCKQWVARTASRAMVRWMDYSQAEENNSWESAVELAHDVMALVDEYGTVKHKYRHVLLWKSDGTKIQAKGGGIYVRELGFEQADIGGQTWNAAVLLARRIARGIIDISKHARCIELGCGTGLLGFTIAHLFEKCAESADKTQKSDKIVVMTDYLPTIIEAVKVGARENELLGPGIVDPVLLDWFDMAKRARLMQDLDHVPLPTAHYLDKSEIGELASNDKARHMSAKRLDPVCSKGAFDLVVAADVLYEVEQCLVIPRLADFLLAQVLDNEEWKTTEAAPQFIVTTPLRSTHWTEVAAFEAEMAKIPTLTLKSKDDASRAEDMATWVASIATSEQCLAADIKEAMVDDAKDSRKYRTYIFERCGLA